MKVKNLDIQEIAEKLYEDEFQETASLDECYNKMSEIMVDLEMVEALQKMVNGLSSEEEVKQLFNDYVEEHTINKNDIPLMTEEFNLFMESLDLHDEQLNNYDWR